MRYVESHANAMAKSIAEIDKNLAELSSEASKIHLNMRQLEASRAQITQALRSLARVSEDPDALKACAAVDYPTQTRLY
jgi:hypothetical protein